MAALGVAPLSPVSRFFLVTLNAVSIVPLTLLALAVPWRRGGRVARALVVGIGAALLLAIFFEFEIEAFTEARGLPFQPGHMTVILVQMSALACLLLMLDATVSARGPIERRMAAIFLAAFVLRASATGVTTIADDPTRPLIIFDGSESYRLNAPWSWNLAFALYAGLWIALLAVPAVLLVNRLRGGMGAGSPAADVLVVAMLPAGLLLGWGLGAPYAEYGIVRPILLTYALLQFQMLGVDVRRSEGLLGLAGLAGLLATFVIVDRGSQPFLGASSTGVAVVVTIGLAGLLALPLLRIVLHPAEADAPRRLLVYRAALEAAQRGGDASASETLKALRRELGVSDKEHALLASQGGVAEGVAALVPGSVILDRYRVIRPLGRGASGEVVLARDERLQRDVAIKRLAGHVRRDARAVQSFEREMRLASALHHPNVVAIHDVETIGDDAFLIMEYMPGGSLQERIDVGKLNEAEAVGIARDVLSALAALHEKGIVHRDVKPSNVLLDANGRAKLADFNVARDAVSGETIGGASDQPVGTIAYMSPEQARGLRATDKSDLYGVAATLYASLAGAPPIAIEGLDEHGARMRVAREPPALPLAGVSERMNAALARGLAKSPGERYAGAAAMREALE